MNLVRFANGHFGIRRRTCLFWYEYCDLECHGLWWSKSNYSFKDCTTDDEDKVRNIFKLLQKETVIE